MAQMTSWYLLRSIMQTLEASKSTDNSDISTTMTFNEKLKFRVTNNIAYSLRHLLAHTYQPPLPWQIHFV